METFKVVEKDLQKSEKLHNKEDAIDLNDFNIDDEVVKVGVKKTDGNYTKKANLKNWFKEKQTDPLTNKKIYFENGEFSRGKQIIKNAPNRKFVFFEKTWRRKGVIMKEKGSNRWSEPSWNYDILTYQNRNKYYHPTSKMIFNGIGASVSDSFSLYHDFLFKN
jgi:hypothetical protein